MKSLRKQMILSYVFIVFLCEIFTSIPISKKEIDGIKQNIRENAEVTLMHVNRTINSKIDIAKTMLRTASIYVETHELEKDETEDYFEQMLRQEVGFSNLFFGNYLPAYVEGGIFFQDDHSVPPVGYDQTSRDWFKGAMQIDPDAFCITDPHLATRTNKVVMTISRQTKGGVLGIDITPEEVNGMIQSVKFSKSGESFLINKEGVIVAASNPEIQGDFFDNFPQLADDKKELFSGNLVVHINSKDNIYAMGRAITNEGGWTFISVGPKRELYSSLYTSILDTLATALLSIAISCALGFFLSRSITKPIKIVATEVNKIASGNADLTHRLSTKSRNEIGSLVEGFNGFMAKLQEIVSQLKGTKQTLVEAEDDLQINISGVSESIKNFNESIGRISSKVDTQVGNVQQTSSTIAEITENISSLKRMIETQSSGISEASAAVEEMIGNISSVNQSMDKMASSFKTLETESAEGMQLQKKVTDLVNEIAKQSESLRSANVAISDVAAQTSLLAMNAAIEAAHAGESGKGFSVVADEIRKLSESSSEQSKKITSDIKGIQETINSVVESSHLSSGKFNQVQEQINLTDILVEQVHSAMTEQQEGSTQIMTTLKMMNDSTAEVKSASDEMTVGSNIMLEEIKKLQDATAEIKDTMGEMSGSAQAMNKTNESLSLISGNVGSSINEMSGQLDQFKV